MSVDATREERHSLVLGTGAVDRVNADTAKIVRLHKLWQNPIAVKRGIRAVILRRAVVFVAG